MKSPISILFDSCPHVQPGCRERDCSGAGRGERYQFHNHESRDGLYIDSVFTQSAAGNLTRDLSFDGTIVGNVTRSRFTLIMARPAGRQSLQ